MLANAAQDAAPELAALSDPDTLIILTCPYCASGTVDPGQWDGLSQVTSVEI